MPSRDEALALDATDPLRDYGQRFVPVPEGLIYLDGNSLGRLPRDTPHRVQEVVEAEWGGRLIRGWDEGWIELPTSLGDRLGQHLLGAAPGQTVVADSTTVCFYKLAAAALAARPGRTQIVTDRDNFPTDRYVLEGLAQQTGHEIVWIEGDPHAGPTPEDVEPLINDQTALVSFSQVSYRSAHIADVKQITEIAHAHGALT
ncbi:MAG: aminotransferase class V-fold PLP-dependent enzyme, partial [Solirubrobacteraceae bacterium]